MRRLLLMVMLLAPLGPASGLAQSLTWTVVQQSVRASFPDVPALSTDSLAARLARGETPTLLDVRTAPEYAVSHLPGARRLDPDAPDLAALAGIPRDAPLVVYCSVGYRSAKMARRLRAAGFTDVENLEGSIFRWANEGRLVVRDGLPVREVHPYDAVWGRLLDPALRSHTPR